MDEKIKISGFADEISQDFEKQLQVVTELGMKYISLRSAYGKSINEYTVEEVQEKLLPLLQKYNVEVSSIGSSIGKIEITDEAGFTRQLLQLQELCKICKILSCRYIRMFSFFIPEGEKPEQYKKQVVSGMKKFTEVAKDADIVLLHENEKEIYGDTGKRCLELLEEVNSPNFKAAFDFANFVQCEQNTVNCWEMLKPYIVYIHIKDALYENQINVLFGTGDGRCEQLLRQGICREGYEGFLTLEPHLVQFEALASLERGKADVIRKNLAKDGEKGYRMQYQALSDMLKKIEKPERKIRFGIIGVGSQGNAYASLLTGKGDTAEIRVPHAPEHAGVGALCDNDPQREAFCRKKYPNLPFYKDWKELVDSGDVDAVITTVPHYLHTEIAIYCLEHNRNVLVEKPAGVFAKAVRQMNECAQEHPEVTFGIMFNQRTNSLYRRIREIIQSGELGEIRRSSWIINSWWRPDCYYKQSSWRATWGGEGGGVLVNQAPHQLDLWQWMCGIPTKVYAKCKFGAHRDIDVENDVTIVTEYENGSTGTFITCTHDPVGTDRLEIDLDGGKIVVEDSKKATVMRFCKSEDEMNRTMDMSDVYKLTQGNSASGGLYTTEIIQSEGGWGSQHAEVMENFALHILDGTKLLSPGSDGINGVNLANAAILSSWLGKEVDNPPDEDLYLKELNRHIEAEGKFPQRGQGNR